VGQIASRHELVGNLTVGQKEGLLLMAWITRIYMYRKLVFPILVGRIAKTLIPSKILQTPSIWTLCGSKGSNSVRICLQSVSPSGVENLKAFSDLLCIQEALIAAQSHLQANF